MRVEVKQAALLRTSAVSCAARGLWESGLSIFLKEGLWESGLWENGLSIFLKEGQLSFHILHASNEAVACSYIPVGEGPSHHTDTESLLINICLQTSCDVLKEISVQKL